LPHFKEKKMKVFQRLSFLFLSVACVLALNSCNKDDDPTPNDLIIGTWKVTNLDATITVNGLTFYNYLISQGLSASEAQLLSDQATAEYEDTGSGNIEIIKGGTYKTTDSGNVDTGTWELTADGKTLTLDKGTVDEGVFTVTTLTSSKMSLSGDTETNDGGIAIKISLKVDLTKQ
jgi:hypothetical protein